MTCEWESKNKSHQSCTVFPEGKAFYIESTVAGQHKACGPLPNTCIFLILFIGQEGKNIIKPLSAKLFLQPLNFPNTFALMDIFKMSLFVPPKE